MEAAGRRGQRIHLRRGGKSLRWEVGVMTGGSGTEVARGCGQGTQADPPVRLVKCTSRQLREKSMFAAPWGTASEHLMIDLEADEAGV